MNSKFTATTFCLFLLLFCNCYEFATLQTAKTLSSREISIMPAYGPVWYTHTGNFTRVSNSFGFQCGYGVSDRWNVYLHYSRIQLIDYNAGYNFFGIDPKISIIKNRMAFSLPVCLYFGENIEPSDAGNIQPTLLYTRKINRYFDATLAPKWIVYLPAFENLIAINGNTAIHLFDSILSIIPEIGFATKPGTTDRFLYGGVGFGYTVKPATRRR